MDEVAVRALVEKFGIDATSFDAFAAVLEKKPTGFDLNNIQRITEIKQDSKAEDTIFLVTDDSDVWIFEVVGKKLDIVDKAIVKSSLPKWLTSNVVAHYKVTSSKVSIGNCSKVVPGPKKGFMGGKILPVIIDKSDLALTSIPIELKISEAQNSWTNFESNLTKISLALGLDAIEYARYYGSLAAEGDFMSMIRREKLDWNISETSYVSLWQKKILLIKGAKFMLYAITPDIRAEVYEDGQLTVQYTQNRFSSASHGSIGMNLLGAALSAPTHDKKKSDSRITVMQIIGADWQAQISVDPEHINHCRALATHINRLSDELARESDSKNSNPTNTDIADSLAKLVNLKNQGLLSDEEFDLAKRKLLS